MFKFVVLLAAVALASAHREYPCGDTTVTVECAQEFFATAAGCVAPSSDIDLTVIPATPYAAEAPSFEVVVDKYITNFYGLTDAVIGELYTDAEKNKTVMSVRLPEIIEFGRENMIYSVDEEVVETIDTAFRVVWTNFIVRAEWEGVENLTAGDAAITIYVQNASFIRAVDKPEAYVSILNNPNGQAALVATRNAGLPGIFRNEEGKATGTTAGYLFWTNFICQA